MESSNGANIMSDLEATRCVFRLPKTTTESNPQAYAPRRLGLGPYHHHRTDYRIQLHKITRVRRFLAPHKLHAFEQIVADLVEHEPLIRACYDDFLDFDIKTLARILAVDALYLLQLLDARRNGEINDEMMENVGDVLMLENQIPVALFKVALTKVLQPHEISSPESVLSMGFREFCQAHSPLHLSEPRQEWMDRKQLHLLDRMYHSIVTNRGHNFDQISLDILPDFSENPTTILGFFGKQTAAPPQILAIVKRAKRIRDQLKGGVGDVELTSGPTAFELSETAGVRFKRSRGGIRDIIYYVDGSILQLPIIRIDGNSEIVMRNLVAYEAASTAAGARVELAEYVDLMCGLICSKKDVDILNKAEIIVGGLSDEEIVGVFEGLGGLMMMGDGRKRKWNVVEGVGKTYDHVGGNVHAKRYVNKCLSMTWRFLLVVTAVAVLAVLLMQAFCSMFVCGHSSGRSVVFKERKIGATIQESSRRGRREGSADKENKNNLELHGIRGL